jgi:energy-converting hydrogenase Eha subunit E
VDGEAYLDETGASDLSISANFLVLLGFMAAGSLFSFVSMRAAIHKKSKQG